MQFSTSIQLLGVYAADIGEAEKMLLKESLAASTTGISVADIVSVTVSDVYSRRILTGGTHAGVLAQFEIEVVTETPADTFEALSENLEAAIVSGAFEEELLLLLEDAEVSMLAGVSVDEGSFVRPTEYNILLYEEEDEPIDMQLVGQVVAALVLIGVLAFLCKFRSDRVKAAKVNAIMWGGDNLDATVDLRNFSVNSIHHAKPRTEDNYSGSVTFGVIPKRDAAVHLAAPATSLRTGPPKRRSDKVKDSLSVWKLLAVLGSAARKKLSGPKIEPMYERPAEGGLGGSGFSGFSVQEERRGILTAIGDGFRNVIDEIDRRNQGGRGRAIGRGFGREQRGAASRRGRQDGGW
ncbi:hypothetical protein TeGR_g2875 [Tetraparma gracilis]|uniref:Uncharacterized protein n=1 Tax=Tetraparma gracilis TaxID=2962635 RepID=A0ABQ6MF60_9STRA|nr:hypothetical protein TeGR_g2875 [Tetraparma gracilis]